MENNKSGSCQLGRACLVTLGFNQVNPDVSSRSNLLYPLLKESLRQYQISYDPFASIMALTSVGVLATLVASYLFLRVVLVLTQDAKEPPAILTNIPFLAPLIATFKEKGHLHVKLRCVRL